MLGQGFAQIWAPFMENDSEVWVGLWHFYVKDFTVDPYEQHAYCQRSIDGSPSSSKCDFL